MTPSARTLRACPCPTALRVVRMQGAGQDACVLPRVPPSVWIGEQARCKQGQGRACTCARALVWVCVHSCGG